MAKSVKGWPLVLGYLGLFLMFEGFVTLLPIAITAFYPGEIDCYVDFLIPGSSAIVLGAVLFFGLIYRKEKARFKGYEDALLLVLIWIFAVLLGAIPFLSASMRGMLGKGMDFSEAMFESISGYSATGYTVYPLEMFPEAAGAYCPHVFMFHRALMQFVGGVGLVLIVAGAVSDRYNLRLYSAEGHNDKLLPNLGRSAKLIFGIYSGYIILGSVSFWLAGMDFFDAFCHSAAAVATGGFSSRAEGMVYFQSAAFTGNGIFPGNAVAIEVVAMVLMLLGATNFVLHTFLFRGKIREFFKDVEIRFGLFLIVLCIIIGTVSTVYLYAPEASNSTFSEAAQTGTDFWTSLRYSSFNIISSITTTGFTNFSSVKQLGEVATFLGILVMIVGAGMGSTGGAIKQYRMVIVMKDFYHSIVYKFAPSRQLTPMPVYRLGQKKELTEGEVAEAHNFSGLYLLTVVAGTLVLLLLPYVDFADGLYEIASGLSGTGQSIIDFYEYKALALSGQVPYYCYEVLLWTISASMFLGRLEILPLFYALNQVFIYPVKQRRKSRSFVE